VFVTPSQRSARKFFKCLWGFVFSEIIIAIEYLTEKQWKKIRVLAIDQIGGLPEQNEEMICQKAGVRTGRAFCVEDDSE
jgi:hypothetical protein